MFRAGGCNYSSDPTQADPIGGKVEGVGIDGIGNVEGEVVERMWEVY